MEYTTNVANVRIVFERRKEAAENVDILRRLKSEYIVKGYRSLGKNEDGVLAKI